MIIINDIQKSILDAIDYLIDNRLKYLKFNRYATGKIITINEDNTYNVEINGEISVLKAREDLILLVSDIVYIMVPNNNFSFAFIDCKRP